MKPEWDENRQKLFEDRYALKTEEGDLEETDVSETWSRLAETIGMDRREIKDFYRALKNFGFVPAGRQLAGIGSGMVSTFYNCYGIPFHNRSYPEKGRDSRQALMDTMSTAVEIQARGGGVGFNFSVLRPINAPVRKVHGVSSGVISWMIAFNAVFNQLRQGGSRRGASIDILSCWHPEIFRFIKAKEEEGEITMANISVALTDDFMQAVKEDKDWELKFPDTSFPRYDEEWDGNLKKWISKDYPVKTYDVVKAREIWDSIAETAHASGEPGIVWLERANVLSNTSYIETLLTPNPCLTKDDWVITEQGPRKIEDIIGDEVNLNLEGFYFPSSGFSKTGIKEVYKITTKRGYEIKATSNHRIRVQSGWREVKNLYRGHHIKLNEIKQKRVEWKGKGSEREGYLLGSLVGDGWISNGTAHLAIWDKDIGSDGIKRKIIKCIIGSGLWEKHRSDFAFFNRVDERKQEILNSVPLRKLANSFGITSEDKTITDEVERANSEFYKGFIRGLFDSDGYVCLSKGGRSIRITQSNLSLLKRLQRMFSRLGILSTIYKNRRKKGTTLMPDGKGGKKEYERKATHEININKESFLRFCAVIGSNHIKKLFTMKSCIDDAKREPYKEDYFDEIESIESIGEKEVFDASVETARAFSCNGIVVHNCAEQILPAWGVCNLGAVNLVSVIEDGSINYEKLDFFVRQGVRFLDTVIDRNQYILSQTKDAQMQTRRIGLGTMGLADALILLDITYGSEKSINKVTEIYRFIRNTAYEESTHLAETKGCVPGFYKDKYLEQPFVKRLPNDVRDRIASYGIRNLSITTQAPTGTTSRLAGVSQAIEPNFAATYTQKDGLGTRQVKHPLADRDSFISAHDLSAKEHIDIQSAVQRFVDSSVSKTINAPEDSTVEDVKEAYMYAYDKGCKGVTYFREGSIEGVLSSCPECDDEVCALPEDDSS